MELDARVLRRVKEIISKVAEKHGVDVDKVILFGSRVRGTLRRAQTGTY